MSLARSFKRNYPLYLILYQIVKAIIEIKSLLKFIILNIQDKSANKHQKYRMPIE